MFGAAVQRQSVTVYRYTASIFRNNKGVKWPARVIVCDGRRRCKQYFICQVAREYVNSHYLCT